MKENLGIYIHIPFCVQKCRYCDFTSYAGMSEELKNRYIKSLINNIKQAAIGRCAPSLSPLEGRSVDSVFFGGGTPSLLSPEQLGEIMEELRSQFRLTDDCEITMEANPGTVSLETLKGYRNLGFNRISFGVQSMEPEILKILGRIHGPEEAAESVRLAREAGFENLNLDLMFGIPGQTLEHWKSTLTKITDLKPEHISFYSLQVEEGTPIYNEIKFGRPMKKIGGCIIRVWNIYETRDITSTKSVMEPNRERNVVTISNTGRFRTMLALEYRPTGSWMVSVTARAMTSWTMWKPWNGEKAP